MKSEYLYIPYCLPSKCVASIQHDVDKQHRSSKHSLLVLFLLQNNVTGYGVPASLTELYDSDVPLPGENIISISITPCMPDRTL